ncbi:cardiolipin synthase [Poritiphilus flavus]|uniref:Cardiolipin synthase n=1 Tax=Poritiphilus flavus TaxID=2697053 RepID=A0A6L9EB00_9FLAO|nr:cardiolipin synthase [Poritiphilus flavus]NAS11937.1 cardiolipin synthase [Poritiphilus flavus]
MWWTIAVVLYILIALSLVVSLLFNGVRPAKTLGWLLAIFTLPVAGILFYLVLGRNRRKQKLQRMVDNGIFADSKTDTSKLPDLFHKNAKLIRLIHSLGYYPLSTDNHLTLLKDGKETFDHIFTALQKASRTIHLQYYIFEEGELADRLLELFASKVNSGVQVRLIYDGIGSFSLSRAYLKKLKDIGVEVYPFLPFRFGRFLSSLNYRNHRKIIVVDGSIGFTGGINISDKYLKGDPMLGTWHDMHLEIEGAAASYLDDIFLKDWFLVSGEQIKQPVMAENTVKAYGEQAVHVIPSGPNDGFSTIEKIYFTMITEARKYVYITNPYIIPSQTILQALQTAALSGVDVRLLVSTTSDSKIVGWSVSSYFESFLKAGVRIFQYPDGFLHSKVIVSDDHLSTVGTANLDDRSFHQNYEVNAVVYDKGFANFLREDFLKDSAKSQELIYSRFTERPWHHRLREGFARLFSPVL